MTLHPQSSIAPVDGAPGRRGLARVCIVTGELAGPDFNGGIGTTNRALAEFLNKEGYRVDILYTRVENGRAFSHRGTFEDQMLAYREMGIELVAIDHKGAWNDWPAKSWLSMQHLIRQQYDLAFFDDTHGTGYYPLLARRTGCPELHSTRMCVTAHSATQWIFELNKQPITTFEEYRLMEMERRSIELADVLRAPSKYILEKYRSYGWQLPGRCVVVPNLLPSDEPQIPPRRHVAIKEIVFFGRLERRKGLWMFCRALDRLQHRLLDTQVTFLGKSTYEDGGPTRNSLIKYSARWPFPIRLLSDFNRDQALAYLKGEGRLAVMPSPEDNSPSVVLECLSGGIPFLACSGSGGQELLDEATRKACTCPPTVDDLCRKLSDVLERGAATGQRSFDVRQVEKSIGELVTSLTGDIAATDRERAPPNRPVLIALVPRELDPRDAAKQVDRWIEEYAGEIDIEIITPDLQRLTGQLPPSASRLTSVNFSSLSDSRAVIKALSHRPGTEVIMSRLDCVLSQKWLDRARQCFAERTDIAALTGMVWGAAVDDSGARDVSADIARPVKKSQPPGADENRTVERYLTGNTPALFSLLLETNSGFAVIRSDGLAKLDHVSPFDRMYDRGHRMEDWIHEIMLHLHAAGSSFELIPDLPLDSPPRELPFDAFRLTEVMRSSAELLLKAAPGSDKAVLARLAIDTGLARERALARANFLASLSETVGKLITAADVYQHENHTRQLAILASAGGQIELALDLSASLVVRPGAGPLPSIAELVDTSVNTIDLIATLKSGNYRTLNLDEDYSFKILQDSSGFELHANSFNKGTASLLFPNVDLAEVNCFVCETAVLHTDRPLRLKIDITSGDGKNPWSADRLITKGGEGTWSMTLPDRVRTTCRVILSVEVADPYHSSEGALTRWTTASFTRQP